MTSLDDRLARALREINQTPEPDVGRALGTSRRLARRKRFARRALAASSLSIGLALAMFAVLTAPSEPPSFRTPPGRAIAPEPVPSDLSQRYGGASERYRLGMVAIGPQDAHIFAFRRESRWCLRAERIPDLPEEECFPSLPVGEPGNRRPVSWKAHSLESLDGGSMTLVWGSAAEAVGAISITSSEDASRVIEIVRPEGVAVSLFATVVSHAADELEVIPLDETGSPYVYPRCGPDQYTPEIKHMWETSGAEVTTVHISLIMRGLRGEPLPCHLLVRATLTLEDGQGTVLAIEGNGSSDTTDIIAVDRTTDFPAWKWQNWCKGTNDIIARVQLDDGRQLEITLQASPSCRDSNRPSVLLADDR